ncbi:MAG: hypothetical protein NC924_03185 [Candidatus Omnitrophica bacterium]|nr:hypothetical protein [Candidatus Omnitrophota bacterium]
MQKAEIDRKEINRIHEEIKALLVKKEDVRLESVLRMRELLTPEQFAQFDRDMCRHQWKKNKHGAACHKPVSKKSQWDKSSDGKRLLTVLRENGII